MSNGIDSASFPCFSRSGDVQTTLQGAESIRRVVPGDRAEQGIELELSDIYWKRRLTSNWKRRVENGEMTPKNFREECVRYSFGDGELTAEEQSTWDRCSSNAEYHYLGSGKTFVGFGKALAEAMLATKKK